MLSYALSIARMATGMTIGTEKTMELKIGGLCPLLQVFDMPASIAFYRDVLGFEVASPVPEDEPCDWVLLRLHESRADAEHGVRSRRAAAGS